MTLKLTSTQQCSSMLSIKLPYNWRTRIYGKDIKVFEMYVYGFVKTYASSNHKNLVFFMSVIQCRVFVLHFQILTCSQYYIP